MLRRIATRLTKYSTMYALNWSTRKGYLHETGWTRSFRSKQSVDVDGAPIPWITYSSISFLAERVRKDMRIFEFGSGNSTLWWCARAASVVSVEHDASWFEKMRGRIPNNGAIVHVGYDGRDSHYAEEITKYHREFHLVVIDGRDRVRCAKHCQSALTEDGVIVWDNSEREYYRPGIEFLRDAGFRRIDFHGMGPINPYAWSTSVFYRSGNCLGL